MKLLIATVALCLVATALAYEPLTEDQSQFLFSRWIKEHGKVYEMDEIQHRYGVFKDNLAYIMRHNEAHKKGEHTYWLAMNEFGDQTFEEFRTTYLGYKPVQNQFMRSKNVVQLPTTDLPTSINWVEKGAVTPVKNQGQCGSCWSFSTTGSVEGARQIATGQLISLSEQQLVDCSTAEGNQGCQGGLMDSAFEYIIKEGGLCTESSYPYSATGPNQCQASSCQDVTTITGYTDVQHNDQSQLKAAVAMGPVSIAIEADKPAFQFYSGGVFNDASCGTQLDHGVLIVGYGSESGQDYWRVKNSWGASWGLSGYILMARDDSSSGSGMCGLAMQPSYPTGAKAAN